MARLSGLAAAGFCATIAAMNGLISLGLARAEAVIVVASLAALGFALAFSIHAGLADHRW